MQIVLLENLFKGEGSTKKKKRAVLYFKLLNLHYKLYVLYIFLIKYNLRLKTYTI